jgi:hypothetical protein
MIERQTNRQKHSNTSQLADGQIARQTNRQTDRETLLLYYGSTMCVTTTQYCKKARLELYSTVNLNQQLTDNVTRTWKDPLVRRVRQGCRIATSLTDPGICHCLTLVYVSV